MLFRFVSVKLPRRDHLDSTRSVSPLKKAEDAIVLDSTHLEIDEVVKQILGIIEVSLNPLQTLD
jgi:cytidylate kinase